MKTTTSKTIGILFHAFSLFFVYLCIWIFVRASNNQERKGNAKREQWQRCVFFKKKKIQRALYKIPKVRIKRWAWLQTCRVPWNDENVAHPFFVFQLEYIYRLTSEGKFRMHKINCRMPHFSGQKTFWSTSSFGHFCEMLWIVAWFISNELRIKWNTIEQK